ncbi:MAG: protein-glutamate O-methyltransferase CheR [Haloarculaceae archaeon]
MTQSRNTAGLEAVLEYIEDELSFAASYYNEAYLDRRVTARLRRTDAETYREYLRVLRDDEDEQEELLNSLSINVTSFFRNPEMWERLRPVLRDLTDEHRTVRLWSAPCSDGREPYSLAMLALDDPEIDARRIEITATDISDRALDIAREGVYETTQTTDIDEELELLDDYSPYVEQDDDCFRVRESVREMVSFRRHDLIRDEPLGGFELVMCRNLLIYISTEYKEPILETLDGALVDRGYLVIGMTETLSPTYKSRYESVDKESRIHRRL